ncbi:ATP-binding protein, partial [Streptomyces sp. NPDC047461]|uniref:ATP-binding protein n=1 Tax=Streptomyces sp. NPDC047461 TaxID=3155619 RepID=UPI0033F7CC26
MSTAWRRWASNDPRALIEYVQRGRPGERASGAPASLLGTPMPAPGDGPPAARASALYEAFAALCIQYADEPTTSDPGRQTIRPPDQVLRRPRHGTCLDLAVTFAGACLDAGLHPLIIVLAGAKPGDPAHAMVAVWLDGNWSNRAHRDYRWDEQDPDWQTLPPDFIDQLAENEDSPGSFLAIDITGVTSRADTADPRRQEQQSWAQSVAYAATLLQEAAQDRWSVTLDVGLGYEHCEPHPLPYRPSTDVLAPPYLPVPATLATDESNSGPLKFLWARHDAIRFYPRDELDFLQDWFQAPDPLGPRTRIALLHGVGGAGKTRLAAELAHRLSATGWYTGFLVRDPDPQDRAWLSDIASPLLVVVDYVEDRKSGDVINVLRTLREREAPTCLLLTARTVSGWWEEEIAVALKEDGLPYTLHDSALAARHPRQTGVYRAAVRSFGGSELVAMGSSPPPDPDSGRWTTLDLVMLAWLAARVDGAGGTPVSEKDLYEKILDHELGYWVRAYKSRIGMPSKRTKGMLREAGACLSLLAPQEERLDHTLKAIKGLASDGTRRDEIAALLADLLPAAPEDGMLAVRPDPLGTHLASSVFSTDLALLRDCLKEADEDEQLNACVGVSRFASSSDESTMADIAQAALDATPGLWQPALSVAATQGGVLVKALERFAEAEGTPLPLAELAATVPIGHSTLRGLALIAARRSEPDDAGDTSEEARAARASWLNNLAVRQSQVGDRAAALTSITEAVDIRRTLAQANPAAFLPNLAMSLNNLANRQSDTGDRAAALTSITEATELYRTLAQANPAAFLPNLAGSLNNLANQQSQVGDRAAALTSITEATELYRTLAQANPAAFLPDLA